MPANSPSSRLAVIATELRKLEERRSQLLAEQTKLTQSEAHKLPLTAPASVAAPHSPEEKVALFLSLFACRTDVYPRLWENSKTGLKGYSPACRNEWVRGICEKPRVKCTACPHQAFPPLDNAAVRDHLTGHHTIGTYAIRADDTCTFLAADFDGSGWRKDLTAYRRAAANFGLEVAAERSRSGNGGHAWLFFAEPVPAALARQLGTFILAHAAILHPTLRLETYDRLFPNQDTLPSGGFGNLIALPLQKAARDCGNSIFLNDDLDPITDQWAHLAGLTRHTRDDLDTALVRATPPVDIGFPDKTAPDDSESFQLQADEAALDLLPGSITRDLFPHALNAVRTAQLEIPITKIPARLTGALKRLATFANPIFHEKQRLRFPAYDTPRFLFTGELHPDRLVLPRGVVAEAAQLVRRAGGRLNIIDQRPSAAPFAVTFNGSLTAIQHTAVEALFAHDEGVLVAPPGAGKTVMACALLARRGVKTLILVHRNALLEQWRERLTTFLDLGPRDIHRLGGAKRTANASIAIGMLQTVARCPLPQALLAPYAHVIIDECHHVPAAGFEAALKACPARFIVGLTATPRRKDGLQKLLHLQCGPARHTIVADSDTSQQRHLIVRTCSLDLPPPDAPIHELWSALVNSRARNEQIAADIASCLRAGRAIAVLSDRRVHLTNLQAHTARLLVESTDNSGIQPTLHRLNGSTSRHDRAAILADLATCADTGHGFALFATASLLGEGFDLPQLDTLFLTTPVSFSGRVIQYAGRLHRSHANKTDVRIYDYHEPAHRLSVHMHRKRANTLKKLGYTFDNGTCATFPLFE